MAKQRRLTGYRRPNGAVGTRNHVAVLPVDDLSNAAAEAVAAVIPGALALPHAFGRLQFGEDLDLTFRTLIGIGSNPNAAAVVVIGIEPNWTARVVEGIAKTGKPVEGFSIEGLGDLKIIERAGRVTQQFLQDASEHRPRARRALGDPADNQGRRVRHHHRPRLVPGHGLPQRQVGRRGRHDDLRRDQRADRRRALDRRALHQRPGACPFPVVLRRLHRHDRSDRRQPAGLPTHAGQHRRRAVDDRRKGVGEHRQDRHRTDRRSPCARRSADDRAACTSWTRRRLRPSA